MPLFIPVLIAGASLFTGFKGARKLQRANTLRAKANQIAESCQARIQREGQLSEASHSNLAQVASRFDALKERTLRETIERVRVLLLKIGQRANVADIDSLVSVQRTASEVPPWDPAALPFQERAAQWLQLAATGGVAHVAIGALPQIFGVASTGAVISGLSGAAARRAALAWLGGGAVSVGGGGMALGTIIGGVGVVGPVVLVIGAQQQREAEEQLTAARQYEAVVVDWCGKLKHERAMMSAIERRIIELESVCEALTGRVHQMIDTIDPAVWSVDVEDDVSRFATLWMLVKLLLAVLRTPIVGPRGGPTESSETLILNYRKIAGETQ